MRVWLAEFITNLPLILANIGLVAAVVLRWGYRRALLVLGAGCLVLMLIWAVVAAGALLTGEPYAVWTAGFGFIVIVVAGSQVWLGLVGVVAFVSLAVSLGRLVWGSRP